MADSIFVSIPDYPNYMVSPEGNFLSLNYHSTGKPKLLKTGRSRGYSTITLYRDKVALTMQAHKIVATIFCSKPSTHRTEVNHKDGNKLNNHFSNLEWVTSRENQLHAYNVLKVNKVRGNKHGIAKLKEKDIPKILRMIEEKIPYPMIAKKYKVSTATICNINKGLVWGHISGRT